MEWIQAFVIALALALVIRAFLLHPYRIPSSSMEDTLLKGDHIMATKYNYGLTIPFTTRKIWGSDIVPARGDVIIFTFPQNRSLDYVKRVVGLPGETVEVRHKRIYINGKEYINGHEKHTDTNDITTGSGRIRDNFGPVVIRPRHVFTMGDNRDQSYDSRFWGQLPIENIKGKALVIYFSWDGTKRLPLFGRIGRIIR
jgi:signal peptidase I